MKKHFLIFLLSFLFLPIFSVNAETFDLSLNIDQTSYIYNDEVNVKLITSNVPSYGLSSGQFYLSYDNNYFSFSCSNINYKQNITSNEISCNESNGKIILLYVDDDGGDSPINNGEFLEIGLKVNKAVTSTQTTIFSLSGEGFAGVNSGKIVDFTTNGNPTKTISIEKEKDNDKYLKNISITGNSITFSKNKYEYSIEVEHEVTSIEINAEANSSTATVSGTGKKTLSEGDNKIILTVTAENGDKQNYIINVKRNVKENINNNGNNENNDNDYVKDENVNNENNNNQTNTNDRIEGTVDNEKTGVYTYILTFFVIIIISLAVYLKTIKKNKFPKI